MFGFLRRRRSRRLLDEVKRARAAGVGVYVHEWGADDDDPTTPEAMASAVVAWCRETLSGTRRPWGVSDFDIALSMAGSGSAAPRSISLRRLAPSDLYPGDSLIDEVRRFLAQTGDASHVAVALFSWGDATHQVLGGMQEAAG